MENHLSPYLFDPSPVEQRRIDELLLHSHLMMLHEQFARTYEQILNSPEPMRETAGDRHNQLATMYEEDIGVAPRDRHELERRIEEAIESGSRETLAEIVAVVRGQSQNPSSGGG